MKYNIITVYADKIPYTVCQHPATNNYYLNFAMDFSGNQIWKDADAVKNIDSFNDTAMYYQLRKVLEKKNESWNEDSLMEHFMYVDFGNVQFSKEDKKTPLNSLSSSELNNPKLDSDIRYRFMFDGIKVEDERILRGFEVTFDKNKKVRFVPFDKSASMARASRISFIDESIKEEMDRRLLLDFKFDEISVYPSKYFAYRGLYLTDAHRIENEKLILNEKTVIVIDDQNQEYRDANGNKNIPLFTGLNEEYDAKTRLWKFRNIEAERELNLYDGEGILSLEYSDILSDALTKLGIPGKKSSYQVRMPFTKGVLHAVDFRGFYNEYIGADKKWDIVDCFGIVRDLKEAQIILTKSMFKCTGWLKTCTENSDVEDPMKLFFEKVKEYDHGFYVGNTDAQYVSNGYTKLNYQFLNPLKLSKKGLYRLASNHERFLKDFVDPETDTEVMDGETTAGKKAAWEKALNKNPNFKKDPKITSLIKTKSQSSIYDITSGNFIVQGEVRFLSRDLLSLLIHMISLSGSSNKQEVIQTLADECLHMNRFYMPEQENGLKLKYSNYYAILRNPHLSRNDEWMAKPYLKRDSIYNRYFSHLKGIIMVSANSLAPMALGGADFDGDIVKVISSGPIFEAIRDGVYEEINGEFERKLRIVDIPSMKGKQSENNKSISYFLIKNTFSNQVGLISNKAIDMGQYEYSDTRNASGDFNNLCAECTIVTGLEIDAAKSGKHPNENIEDLFKRFEETKESHGYRNKKEKNYFIEAKKTFGELKGRKTQFNAFKSPYKNLSLDADNQLVDASGNSINDSTFEIQAKGFVTTKQTIKNPVVDESIPNVDALPYLFYKSSIKHFNDNFGIHTASLGNLYSFENDEKWYEKLDSTKINNVKDLISCYKQINRLNRKVNQMNRNIINSNMQGRIRTILMVQYDDITNQELNLNNFKINVTDALDETIAYIYDVVNCQVTSKKSFINVVDEMLERVQAQRWSYSLKEERSNTLDRILNVVTEEKSEQRICAEQILFNFNQAGYRLLTYVLTLIKDNAPTEEMIEAAETELSIDHIENELLYFVMYDEYLNAKRRKKTQSLWTKKIIEICQNYLNQEFENSEEKVKTLYYFVKKSSLDRSAEFFWSVLKYEEIEPLIMEKEVEVC